MKKKYLILITLAGFIIAFDQLMKMYIHTQYQLGESHIIIKDFFNFTYVRNTGAAFGIFHDANEILRNIIFLSLPPIAVTIILMILRTIRDNDYVQICALSGVFGGAIGNYIDRVRFGYVIDFLDVHYKQHSWPAFNIADSTIVVGICVMMWLMFKEEKEKKTAAQKKA